MVAVIRVWIVRPVLQVGAAVMRMPALAVALTSAEVTGALVRMAHSRCATRRGSRLPFSSHQVRVRTVPSLRTERTRTLRAFTGNCLPAPVAVTDSLVFAAGVGVGVGVGVTTLRPPQPLSRDRRGTIARVGAPRLPSERRPQEVGS